MEITGFTILITILRIGHSKKRYSLRSLITAFFISVFTISELTACSDSSDINSEDNSIVPTQPQTYTVRIPATMGNYTNSEALNSDATSYGYTFSNTEYVYVYNATTGKILADWSYDYEKCRNYGYLTPTNISADGKHCILTGTVNGVIKPDDKLLLLYDIKLDNTSPDFPPTYSFFDYSEQYSDEHMTTYAIANVTVASNICDGMLTTTDTASFEAIHSLFRFQFNDDNDLPIPISSLSIWSEKSGIAAKYWPFMNDDSKYTGDRIIIFPPDTYKRETITDYVYVALCINESRSDGDLLLFTAIDNEEHEYMGKLLAPVDGLKNGKYYNKNIQLFSQRYRQIPRIYWTNVETEPIPDRNYHMYTINGPYKGNNYLPSAITISNYSSGYCFYMNNGSTIVLDNLNAYYDWEKPFIESNADLNLVIKGKNHISCKNWDACIAVDGNLKISGSGQLIVTCNIIDSKGLFATDNYNKNGNTNALSTDDATIYLTDTKDNGNGTWTFIYDVTQRF